MGEGVTQAGVPLGSTTPRLEDPGRPPGPLNFSSFSSNV